MANTELGNFDRVRIVENLPKAPLRDKRSTISTRSARIIGSLVQRERDNQILSSLESEQKSLSPVELSDMKDQLFLYISIEQHLGEISNTSNE
ncbi:MAG: hypothetical protein KBC15_04245 [Candidatus Levybacteria bacterium]|nr:hypothetical protein [Candidatus Levybacteria bacterium]